MLLSIWKKDWTRLWSYLQLGGASLLASITGLAEFLNSSQFQNVLDKLSLPWYVPVIIAVLGCVTYVAVGRDA